MTIDEKIAALLARINSIENGGGGGCDCDLDKINEDIILLDKDVDDLKTNATALYNQMQDLEGFANEVADDTNQNARDINTNMHEIAQAKSDIATLMGQHLYNITFSINIVYSTDETRVGEGSFSFVSPINLNGKTLNDINAVLGTNRVAGSGAFVYRELNQSTGAIIYHTCIIKSAIIYHGDVHGSINVDYYDIDKHAFASVTFSDGQNNFLLSIQSKLIY